MKLFERFLNLFKNRIALTNEKRNVEKKDVSIIKIEHNTYYNM